MVFESHVTPGSIQSSMLQPLAASAVVPVNFPSLITIPILPKYKPACSGFHHTSFSAWNDNGHKPAPSVIPITIGQRITSNIFKVMLLGSITLKAEASLLASRYSCHIPASPRDTASYVCAMRSTQDRHAVRRDRRTITLCSRRTSSSTTCDPMNLAPPVTGQRISVVPLANL